MKIWPLYARKTWPSYAKKIWPSYARKIWPLYAKKSWSWYKLSRASLLAGALLLASLGGGPAQAAVPDDYLSIGTVALGCGPDFVLTTYGEPTRRELVNTPLIPGRVEEFQYGKSFLVTFADGKAVAVASFAKNGLATPAGVTVGMHVNVLNDTYKTADAVYGDNRHTTTYLYNGATPNTYLKFIVKGFTIVNITCGINFAAPKPVPTSGEAGDSDEAAY